MVARIKAALGGDAVGGAGHLLDGDGDETLSGGLDAGRSHLLGQLADGRAGRGQVERRIARRPEDRREETRIEPAKHEVGVGDGGGSAAPIGGRAWIGAGALRPDPGAKPVEGEDRAAAGGHRLDVQHRATQLYAGDAG